MHNNSTESTDSKDAAIQTAFNESLHSSPPPKVQEILERHGKEGFVAHFVESQAKLISQSNLNAKKSKSTDEVNGDLQFEDSAADIPKKKKSKAVKKRKTNRIEGNDGMLNKSTAIFAKRLSLFRAKVSSAPPGLFSTSKQSKMVKIGNGEIFLDEFPSSVHESSINIEPPTFFAACREEEVVDEVEEVVNLQSYHDLDLLRFGQDNFGGYDEDDIQSSREVAYFDIDQFWALQQQHQDDFENFTQVFEEEAEEEEEAVQDQMRAPIGMRAFATPFHPTF